MIIILNTNKINRTRRFWKSKFEDFIENGKIPRRDFLKIICAVGTTITLSPLIPFGRVLGDNVTPLGFEYQANFVSKYMK